MSNYGWTNADGEPIMDGAAYRYEQYLDSTYEPDPDDFYDRWDDDEHDEDSCPMSDADFDSSTGLWECMGCGKTWPDDDEPEGMEDQWLDSYMEDRLSTMYE